MPRIISVKSRQLTVTAPDQTKERVIARLGSLATATHAISAVANDIDEGSALTVNVAANNIRAGSTLRWRILDRPEDFSASTGLVAVSQPFAELEQHWTTPGSYAWTVPEGVTSISAVLVGGGTAGGPDSRAGGGAVRIIWGSGRAFPSTNTADV